MFLTYILVAAVAAFIPYVATPAIANGVKAIGSPPPAAVSFEKFDRFDMKSATPAAGSSDAANRIVPERVNSDSAV
jgi:hypothetical protein